MPHWARMKKPAEQEGPPEPYRSLPAATASCDKPQRVAGNPAAPAGVDGAAKLASLVMVQVDGLSHTRLNFALERGEMPFLRRLIKREHDRLHRMYAGVPATTAAFQGELFYAVKALVLGCNFLDSASGKSVRMVEPAVAAGVEREPGKSGKEALFRFR